MEKPKQEDYNKSGNMLSPYGLPDYITYISSLEKYNEYLESRVKHMEGMKEINPSKELLIDFFVKYKSSKFGKGYGEVVVVESYLNGEM